MISFKNKSFFWASYADLMTSLFFVMLTLFILTIVLLQRQMKKAEIAKKEAITLREKAEKGMKEIERIKEATEAEMNKIKEIQNAIQNIDSTYFTYNKEHKKHILNIDVEFQTNSADINNINFDTRVQLLNAGDVIQNFIDEACQKYAIQYLLIIEGQASKDGYVRNNELSYERGLSLLKFWEKNGIHFNPKQCEVIVAGSGQDGSLRIQPDIAGNVKNQRFLIHILPKPGLID